MKQSFLLYATTILLLTFTSTIYAQTGNVGIGTTSPTEKLEVNGNIKDATFSTTWTASISYDLNYVILYEGVLYKHLTTTNTATTPDLDGTNWGSISSESVAAEYLQAKLGVAGSGTDYVINTFMENFEVQEANGLALTSNGYVTLKAGVTYEVEAFLSLDYNEAASYVIYTIKDKNSSTEYGTKGNAISAHYFSRASVVPSSAIITPSVDTEIGVYILAENEPTKTYNNQGYLKVKAIANQLPVVVPSLPTPEFLHANMNANESVVAGNNIDNLTIITSSGAVGTAGFSAGTGVVTLSAGVTYKLTAALNATNTSNFSYLVYQWYDDTNSIEFGNKAFISPTNLNVSGSSQPTAVAYITPSVTTEVYLKIISLTGTTVSIDAEYGYITVEAL